MKKTIFISLLLFLLLLPFTVFAGSVTVTGEWEAAPTIDNSSLDATCGDVDFIIQPQEVFLFATAYTCSINISCIEPVIEYGEQARISMEILYTGTQDARMSVLDQDGAYVQSYDNLTSETTILDNIDVNVTETGKVSYTALVYTKDGVGTLVNEEESNEITITVNPAPIYCNFNATISSDITDINAGDYVEFDLHLTNTGDDIWYFEITDLQGASIAGFEGLPSGVSQIAPLSKQIDETCDVSFVVTAVIDDVSKSKQTNVITVNVLEAAESTAMPEVTPTTASGPTATPETSPTTTSEPIEQTSTESMIIDEIIKDVDINTLTILLFIIVALLIILIIIVILVMNKKRKIK